MNTECTPTQLQFHLFDSREGIGRFDGGRITSNGVPGLSIYTRGTRAFLSQWTMTPAQTDNEARSLEDCPERILKTEAIHAVLRHRVAGTALPAIFLQNGGWAMAIGSDDDEQCDSL